MKLKQTLAPLFSIALICTAVLLMSAGKKDGDYDYMKQRLEATKAFTIEVINAMPDDKFDYQPNDDVRTFQAQAYHVVYSIDYYNRLFKGNPQPSWKPDAEDSKSKAELAKWAAEQFDAINETILAADNNPRLTAGIMSYLDHNAHHRGQMITYLRMNGIKPPNYR